jgi:prepilin-type N-terminal cleavage/methylation domain-containing protein
MSKRPIHAFTLIELLVVVTLIVLLLAMLLPSLSSAVALSEELGCQVNMRNIMIATRAYTSDNFGILPYPNWRTNNDHGWLYTMYSNGGMDRLSGLKDGELYPYLNDYHVYRCPADFQPNENDPGAVPGRPDNSRMITSYCMNGSACWYGGTFDTGGGYYKTQTISKFKPNDILYWEADETKAGGWWWDGSNYPFEGLSARHILGGSVVSIDGHTEFVKQDYYYTLCDNTAGPTRLWNNPDSANGN